MICNKTHVLYRFLTMPSLLKSIRPLRVLQPRKLKQQHFANFFLDDNKSFSNSSVWRAEMESKGKGDVNDFNINYDQLLQVQNDRSVMIIDVRENAEIQKTGALPGSVHIPMGDVANELTNLSDNDFSKKYNRELPSKDTKLVFSCMSGKRSSAVRDQMTKLGFKNAYNYTGGWSEWEHNQKRS